MLGTRPADLSMVSVPNWVSVETLGGAVESFTHSLYDLSIKQIVDLSGFGARFFRAQTKGGVQVEFNDPMLMHDCFCHCHSFLT
jgi:hypothetical protein